MPKESAFIRCKIGRRIERQHTLVCWNRCEGCSQLFDYEDRLLRWLAEHDVEKMKPARQPVLWEAGGDENDRGDGG